MYKERTSPLRRQYKKFREDTPFIFKLSRRLKYNSINWCLNLQVIWRCASRDLNPSI